MEVVLERSFKRGLIETHVAVYPLQVFLCPGRHTLRMPAAVSQQKLTQPVPRPELILFPRFAGADQIPQSFVCCIGNPNSRQVTGSIAACQLLSIPAVCLTRSPAF